LSAHETNCRPSSPRRLRQAQTDRLRHGQSQHDQASFSGNSPQVWIRPDVSRVRRPAVANRIQPPTLPSPQSCSEDRRPGLRHGCSRSYDCPLHWPRNNTTSDERARADIRPLLSRGLSDFAAPGPRDRRRDGPWESVIERRMQTSESRIETIPFLRAKFASAAAAQDLARESRSPPNLPLKRCLRSNA
jgi:hypothetical protein